MCAFGLAYARGGALEPKAGADADLSRDGHVDYSSWAVDPTAPGPDLPPLGRSLFDHLFTERTASGSAYRIPFPFSALIERIEARLGQQEYGGGTRVVMIPMGRSLQRTAAAPDYFKYPRIVLAVIGGPSVSEGDAGMLLKDRLYLGYVEKTGLLEVISYNEPAGRFEFQLVKDYRPGGEPKVFYANRAICMSCHQNHAPIFSQAIWSETNANGRAAELLRAQRSDFQLTGQTNIDFPDDIDKSTVRANTLVTLQSVWQEGCANRRDRAQSRRCRAAAFAAVLQYGLSGEQDFGASEPGFQHDFASAFGSVWRERWPQGLRVAQSDLPDRNPFGGAVSAYGGGAAGEGAFDWVAASNVPADLDPLNPRPPREIWRYAGAMGTTAFIGGWAKFFAADDFRAVDAALSQQALRQRVASAAYQARCTAVREAPGAAAFKLECTSDAASAQRVDLAGRFDAAGNGRIDWLNLGPAGQVRDVTFDAGAVQRVGSEFVLRAVPKRKELAARLPDGRAFASVEIRWPAATPEVPGSEPVAARFETVVLDDFALVRRAVGRMLATQPALFDDGPLVRANLMRALSSELGMPERSWCCVDDAGMAPAKLDLPRMNPSAIEKREWQPLFQHCAMCHLTEERFPPNFLSGDAGRVAANLRQCAPRMLVRLSAWGTPVEQRAKSPMPPATAIQRLGLSARQWASSEDLALLRGYLEELSRQQGRAPEVSELLKDGYEALPRCLPESN